MKKCLITTVILIIFFIGSCLLIQLSSHLLQTSDPNESSPNSGQFITIENEKIFIQESGNRQKIAYFFIHGTGSWSELWKPIMKDLSDRGHYAVAIDLEPFGYSQSSSYNKNLFNRKFQAQKLLTVINNLKIQKVILVGHSFGGRATLSLALLAPEKIEKLILVNVALGFGHDVNSLPVEPSFIVSSIINNNFLRNTIASLGTMPFLTKKLVSNFVANEDSISKEIEIMYQRPLSLKNKSQQISDWLQPFLLNPDNELLINREEFKRLSIPVSIIWGDLDTVTPLWQGYAIQKLFKNSRLNSIKGVGHIPMIENPSEFKTLFFNSI